MKHKRKRKAQRKAQPKSTVILTQLLSLKAILEEIETGGMKKCE